MRLQEFYSENPGYAPLLITEGWQVAQLNTSREQRPENIGDLEKHMRTDETFTLLEGSAVLITADEDGKNLELTPMKAGRTYNVPRGIWHNIAMMEKTSVLITENAGTHTEAKETRGLSEASRKKIREVCADYKK